MMYKTYIILWMKVHQSLSILKSGKTQYKIGVYSPIFFALAFEKLIVLNL